MPFEAPTIHLDALALPSGTWLCGEDGGAAPLMAALGLAGPVGAAQDAPLSIGHEGLRIDAWPVAPPPDPRALPEPLHGLLWEGEGETLHLTDAARLPGFDGPDALPDLRVQCLFDPPAAETLAASAPYLAALEPGHWFAAHLLDDRGAPWSHWPRGCGIFLRTHAPFEGIRANLRRFTKLPDGDGWVFLRLAEPRTLLPLLLGLSPGLRGRLFGGVAAMVAIDPDEGIVLRATCTDLPAAEPIRVTPALRATLAAGALARFAGEAERFCRETLIDRPAPPEARAFCRAAIEAARAAGLHDRQAVLLAVAAAWAAGEAGWIAAQRDIIDDRTVAQIGRGRALLRRAH
ncbi:DUF4123 domain-containing protein [Jannaschia sp. Os4]|uniref:DUF4123 domain-containing protein n=1 Tax=Jannaschia sp. Os4 TaxID=2807617 RepID=UPI00193AD40A|nr:DUF4123 domain-containing protein [Jannaschia sp. Os4]MBM2578095.1 DUF4123 domain-containing protein [Jannaschia sp. Os4]